MNASHFQPGVLISGYNEIRSTKSILFAWLPLLRTRLLEGLWSNIDATQRMNTGFSG
jgi:hypothetical protein